MWAGAVSGVSRLAGDFVLDFSAPGPIPHGASSPFTVSTSIYGRIGEKSPLPDPHRVPKKDWTLVMSQPNRTTSVVCHGTPPVCSSGSLFSEKFTSDRNGGGGYTAYLAVSDMHAVSPQLSDLIISNSTFQLTYRRAAARVRDSTSRIVFLSITATVLILWLTVVCRHEQKPTDIVKSVPQRRWVLLMLFFLLLWQNPLLPVTELSHNDDPVLHLCTIIIETSGLSGLFILWLMLVDSLRWTQPAWSCWPFHIPKIILGTLLSLTLLAVQILRQPELLFQHSTPEHPLSNHESGPSKEETIILVLVMGVLYAVLLLTWFIWFVMTMIRTGRWLERLPYAATRYQQLAYRYIFYMLSVVVVFEIVVNAIPIVQFFVHLARSRGTPDGSATLQQAVLHLGQQIGWIHPGDEMVQSASSVGDDEEV